MKINKLIDKCIEDDVDIVKVHIDVLCEYAKEYNTLQQENKQLKSILTELEKHCEVMLRIFEKMSEEQKQEQLDKYVIYDKFLGKIQKLKEKYK